MDPITLTLVSAFVAGAAKGATKVGDSAVSDAYAALRHIVLTSYAKATDLLASVSGVEAKPDSAGRRETLAEELKAAGALDDEKLVTAAEAVLSAVEGQEPAIGVDWSDVRAARLKIGTVRARAGAVGFRAARMEIAGEIEITEIDAGAAPGN